MGLNYFWVHRVYVRVCECVCECVCVSWGSLLMVFSLKEIPFTEPDLNVPWKRSERPPHHRRCHHCFCYSRIYGALFNLMCTLKGNNRRINFKLTSFSLSTCLGATDVHDKARLGLTSKGGQEKAEKPPHVSTCFFLRCLLWAIPVSIHWHSKYS